MIVFNSFFLKVECLNYIQQINRMILNFCIKAFFVYILSVKIPKSVKKN